MAILTSRLDYSSSSIYLPFFQPEKFDTAWVRRFALNFERKISKNAELRAKFENDPQKYVAGQIARFPPARAVLTLLSRFMSSEADLDTEIKNVSILSEHPDLYGEFAKLGCAGSLVSLLAHENADIAIDAIQTISELTDEDVSAEQEQWDSLVNAMVSPLVSGIVAASNTKKN